MQQILVQQGPVQAFCRGFFHIDECYEWNQHTVCLFPESKCKRMMVQGILTLHDNERLVYARAYENIFQGHTEQNVHVEDQIIRDASLRQLLESPSTSKRLTLFIGYQPCHHSSGGRKHVGSHATSCTERLLTWHRSVLLPHHVALTIRCCGLYRAQWEDEKYYWKEGDTEKFAPKTGSAREGLRMLMCEPGMTLTAMASEDWHMLIQLLFPGGLIIPTEMWQQRQAYDQNVTDFLQKIQLESLPPRKE